MIAASSYLPIYNVSGPHLSVSLFKALDLDLQPGGGVKVDQDTGFLIFWTCASWLVLMSILLAVTRIKWLGLLWRLSGLLFVALAGLYAWGYWNFVMDPVGSQVVNDKGVGDDVVRGLGSLTHAFGLWNIEPAVGLYLLSVAVVIGVIASFVPAKKYQRIKYLRGEERVGDYPTTSRRP